MRINKEGLALIKSFEGCELRSYQDIVGVWTVGYGHTKSAKPHMLITQDEAEELLQDDLEEFERGVERLVSVPLSAAQFSALVSFAFNLGVGALSRSTLLKTLNRGNYEGAALEFVKWNKAGGKVVNGLTRRRAAERDLFNS
jgi:lysozyme